MDVLIGIAEPIIEQEETEAVLTALASGRLVQGAKVVELETAFASYCGTKYAVAVNSGTAALHAALYACGVRAGDEVITVPFTFVATANAIKFLGAQPVFVDIDPDNFNLNPELLESAVTSRTKAIMPVHLYGQPCDMAAIHRVARKHNLTVIEDACQAVGAEFAGKRTGSLGDLGCFSLYATKNIMCGEGGVVTTSHADFAATLRRFRQHGMTSQGEYAELGYNYRLSDLLAAIAVAQLKKIDRFGNTRRANAERLNVGLRTVQGIHIPTDIPFCTPAFNQYTIRVTEQFPITRNQLADRLRAAGITPGIYYPAGLHLAPHLNGLGYQLGDFPVTERASREVLSLPVHPRVLATDINHIVDVIRAAAHD